LTRQEPHTCDVCGAIFYAPEDPLRTLEINRDRQDEVIYDLCYDCHASLLKWILATREAGPKEA